ncbi:MAG: hypothetical protein AAFU55_10975 [Pseudomonadota bacterium]
MADDLIATPLRLSSCPDLIRASRTTVGLDRRIKSGDDVPHEDRPYV